MLPNEYEPPDIPAIAACPSNVTRPCRKFSAYAACAKDLYSSSDCCGSNTQSV
jgi:hypothetical protein